MGIKCGGLRTMLIQLYGINESLGVKYFQNIKKNL